MNLSDCELMIESLNSDLNGEAYTKTPTSNDKPQKKKNKRKDQFLNKKIRRETDESSDLLSLFSLSLRNSAWLRLFTLSVNWVRFTFPSIRPVSIGKFKTNN